MEYAVLPQPAYRQAGEDEHFERCLSGDTLGYKKLYVRFSKAMYNTCLLLLNNVARNNKRFVIIYKPFVF